MNIYISGLSYGTNDADLTNLFAEFGEVSSANHAKCTGQKFFVTVPE